MTTKRGFIVPEYTYNGERVLTIGKLEELFETTLGTLKYQYLDATLAEGGAYLLNADERAVFNAENNTSSNVKYLLNYAGVFYIVRRLKDPKVLDTFYDLEKNYFLINTKALQLTSEESILTAESAKAPKKSVQEFQTLCECITRIESRNSAIHNADTELENFFLDYPEVYDELCEQYDINEIIPHFEHVPF